MPFSLDVNWSWDEKRFYGTFAVCSNTSTFKKPTSSQRQNLFAVFERFVGISSFLEPVSIAIFRFCANFRAHGSAATVAVRGAASADGERRKTSGMTRSCLVS